MAAFFGLTFLLTVPIWLASAASGLQLMPGLPVGAVAVVCPAAAALLLTSMGSGRTATRALLLSAVDPRGLGIGAWIAILLICPAVAALSFLILRLSGSPVPPPQLSVWVVLALFGAFLVAAIAEEVGWSGTALGPLQSRWGAFTAGILVGFVWAAWHYPTLLQAHRSAGWIMWWTLGTIALRLIIVWLYNQTRGRIFAAAAFHAVSNLCWQLFPIAGSWFDPRIHALLMSAIAAGIFGYGRLRRRV
ncbi:MAG TPA: CPBP family intramembrane glutamic endopeptidase [Phenylobacterium sp.]